MVWIKNSADTYQTDKWLGELDLPRPHLGIARDIVKNTVDYVRAGKAHLSEAGASKYDWVNGYVAGDDIKLIFKGNGGTLTLDLLAPLAPDASMQVVGRLKKKFQATDDQPAITWVQHGEKFLRGRALGGAMIFDIEKGDTTGLFMLTENLQYLGDFSHVETAQAHAEKWLKARMGGEK
jgi:hypothetical protein